MSMRNRNRREFLLEAGVTIGGIAVGSRLFANSPSRKNKARGKMRGLMVDAARLPESMDYYKRLIEFCADWELNTLHFRLADDQGSALRFTSVPDLVTHKNAFTPAQLKSLAQYAQSHGIDLIPELESFGHTGYITRSPAYSHLLDCELHESPNFAGIIPVSPETLQLFEKLYREVTDIFPSIYLHGGCDEVNWGGSALSREALQKKTRAQIWAEYLNSLNHISERLGKQFIVWGDFVIHKEPDILGELSKNIIIMDWDYSETNSGRLHETLLKVRANDFRGIGAPALYNYLWGARVGAEQLRNIDAYSDAYLKGNDPGALGVILTNWIPSRYIQNSIWDGFAYAAVAFNEGTETARTSAFRRFVERHYRATWNEAWSKVFRIIYDEAPHIKEQGTAFQIGTQLAIPWSNDTELFALLQDQSARRNPFTSLRSLLVQLEPSVKKNLSDFQSFKLCVECLDAGLWREAVVVEQVRKPLERETADSLIHSIAERDQALAEALSQNWDKGRFPDSAAKTEPVIDFGAKDQLVLQWKRAAIYSASLASHPDHLHQLLG